ncbi:MAG: SWIM zinc finger family protein [Acidimicrobiales bacterium]
MAARSRSWDDPWREYPASKPRPVEGGVATRRQRGAMADAWWSKRLVELLDSYGLGARMQRGRRYARQGQLVSFDVQPGLVVAQVQGSRRTPYVTTVRLEPLTAEQWAAVQREIEATLQFAAQLLAGEVPPELEAVFEGAGVALLPRRWGDLRVSCSCPDWESPCKHLAATLYVLADRLDDDPWLLLLWRGRTRAEMLAHLGPGADDRAAVAPWWPLVPGARLPGPAASGGDTWTSEHARAALTRLGPLGVEVRNRAVTDLLGAAYDTLAAEG